MGLIYLIFKFLYYTIYIYIIYTNNIIIINELLTIILGIIPYILIFLTNQLTKLACITWFLFQITQTKFSGLLFFCDLYLPNLLSLYVNGFLYNHIFYSYIIILITYYIYYIKIKNNNSFFNNNLLYFIILFFVTIIILVQNPTTFIYFKKIEYDTYDIDYSIDLINGLFFLHTTLFLNFIYYLFNWFILVLNHYKFFISSNIYTKPFYTNEEVKVNKILEVFSLRSFYILFFITLTGSWWAQQELNWNGLWSWDIIEIFICIHIFIILLYIHDLPTTNYKNQIFLFFIVFTTLLFMFIIRYGLIITRHDFVDFNRLNQKTSYIIKLFITCFVFLLSYYIINLKNKIKLILNNIYYEHSNKINKKKILPFILLKKSKELSYIILLICIVLILLLPIFKITFESVNFIYSIFFDLNFENISIFVIMLFSVIIVFINTFNPTVLYFNSNKFLYKNIFFKNIYNIIFRKIKKPIVNKVKDLFLFNGSTKIKVIHFSSFFLIIVIIIDNSFNTDFRVMFKNHFDNIIGRNQFFQLEFKSTPYYLQIRLEESFLWGDILFNFFDNFLLKIDSFKLRNVNYIFDSTEKISIYYSDFNIIHHKHVQYPLFISSIFYQTGFFFTFSIILLIYFTTQIIIQKPVIFVK